MLLSTRPCKGTVKDRKRYKYLWFIDHRKSKYQESWPTRDLNYRIAVSKMLIEQLVNIMLMVRRAESEEDLRRRIGWSIRIERQIKEYRRSVENSIVN